jgi:hypothetical protein
VVWCASCVPCRSAASSADAAIAALAALTTLLRITLGDAACGAVLGWPSQGATDSDSLPELLAAIRQQSRDFGCATAAVGVESIEPGTQPVPTHTGELRVHRSVDWVRLTACKLAAMLPSVFGVLCRHARSSVRAAAASAAAELIGCCGVTLHSCTGMWLECLFALVHDPWPQVAELASKALKSTHVLDSRTIQRSAPADRTTGVPWLLLHDLLLRQLDTFSAACARGEQDVVAAARQLASAICLAGPTRFADVVLTHPARRRSACLQLTLAFAMSGGAVRAASSMQASDASSVMASTDGALLCAETLLPKRHHGLVLLTSDEVREGNAWFVLKLSRCN